MSNITQIVNDDKKFTTLKKGVYASGLDKILSGSGPFTFFAPSDMAFAKLDKGTFETLLKPENKTKLQDLLNYHIVPGKIAYKDLKDGEKLKSVNGKELLVRIRDNRISIEDAKIENRDLETSNGVIHYLDSVLTKY